jgi:acetate kinase
MREIESSAGKGNERAALSLKMFNYRVKKYIGAYSAAMGGVDIVVFTGGIGENGWEIRENICTDLEFLGIEFDKNKNKGVCSKETVISKDGSRATVVIIPTNEEFVIASDTRRIVENQKV